MIKKKDIKKKKQKEKVKEYLGDNVAEIIEEEEEGKN